MSQSKAQLLDPQGDFTLTGQLIGVGATFSGNVSIAGTLTKQDVTNVDSVGIITAGKQIVMSQGYQLEWKNGSTYRSRIHGDSGNNFIIETGSSNTERLRVKDNGNTGIGTNNPAAPLDVYSSTAATDKDLLMVRSTTGAFAVQCSSIADANPEWRLRTYSSEPIVLSPGNVEAVRIKSNGKVGIGTDPGSGGNLTVYADTPGENVFAIHSDLGTNNNRTFNLYAPATDSGEDPYIFQTGNSMQFKVDSTPSINIAANGRVGIATITPTDAWLDIASSTGTDSIRMRRLSSDVNVASNWSMKPYGKYLYFREGGTTDRVHFTDTGNVVTTVGEFQDSKGSLRAIPRELKGSAYTLVLADAGKCIAISSGGITVPHNVLGTGHAVTIINNSGTDQTITQAASLSMYYTADQSTGNRTLAGRGMATIWFSSGAEAYITGSGLS